MIIEIRRGSFLESSHQVQAQVVDANGEILYQSGPNDFDFFPRSAVKPLQSLLLLQTGAFSSLGLNLRHLALASASHAGETQHTNLVSEWLSQIQAKAEDLKCGAHWPFDPDTNRMMSEEKQKPSRLHNNCSGKHTGFLSVCTHQKISHQDYHLINHPIQIQLKELMQNWIDRPLTNFAIDGCSIPAFQMKFASVAQAFARFASEASKPSKSPSRLVFEAFVQYPELTAGKAEYCTQMMKANPSQVLLKEGAEGVLVACVPSRQLAILVKALDGAERASQCAMDHLLAVFAKLQPVRNRQLFNWDNMRIGEILVRP